MAVARAVLTVFAWDDLVTGDVINNLCALPAGVLYAMLGALIVRAGNVIGWYLPGEGIATAILGLAAAYAVLGVRNPGTLPQPRFVGLLAEWSFASLVCGLAFMFLVFPTGHLPSPRWRPVGALALLVIALTITGFLIHPRQVALPAPGGISLTLQNLGPGDSRGPRQDLRGQVRAVGSRPQSLICWPNWPGAGPRWSSRSGRGEWRFR
jgi:hypothetical protein